MDSQELANLMEQVEAKGISWDKVKEKIKVSHDLLNMYVRSGPVPVSIKKGLEGVLQEGAD